MGFIRKWLLSVFCIFLFLFLLAGNIFLIITLSLDYEYLKSEMVSMTSSLAEGNSSFSNEIEDAQYQKIISYCLNNSEFVFEDEKIKGNSFTIPCEIAKKGKDAVFEKAAEEFFYKIYYNNYSCNFFNCFKEEKSLFFLVSEKSKNFWKNSLFFSIVISLVLILAVFLLVENRENFLIITGVLIIFSSLSIVGIDRLVFTLSNIFSFFEALGITNEIVFKIISIFFSKSGSVFIAGFSIGAFLVILGIVFLASKRFYKQTPPGTIQE